MSGNECVVVGDVLGTDTHNDGLRIVDLVVDIGIELASGVLVIGQQDLILNALAGLGVLGTELEEELIALFDEDTLDEVHLGRTDEAGNELVAGTVIKPCRAVDLLDEAVLHNDDAVTHGHSFGLVVGNVDEGGTDSLMKLGKLGTHLCTQLSVKVGERLVEKEDLRLTNDSTTESNTLTLTAGESLRLTVEQVLDVEDAGSLFNAALDLILRSLAELKTECHILENGHMGIKSVVLENHCDVAILRSDVVDQLVTDVEFAVGNLLKAGDHTQGGGLTASGRTDEDDKFLVLNLQTEIRNGNNVTLVLLVDVFKS